MRKSRLMNLILCLLIFSLSVSACSTKETTKKKKKTTKKNTKVESLEDTDETDEPSESVDTTVSTETTLHVDTPATTDTTPVETANDRKSVYTISNEVIVDDSNCSFIITEATTDSIWGFTLKVYCENKTADKNLMFSLNEVSVNGYMVDPFWATQVAAGKKANDEVSFSSDRFDEIGITSADEITFSLRIYDYDDWSADPLIEETYIVYPTGLSPDEVVSPNRLSSPNETVVVDNDQVSFIILGTSTDSIWGYTLICYLENKTDKTLMYSWNDVSVNGFMADPYWASDVAPGKKSYCSISFSNSEFEKNGITEVNSIEYSLRIFDSDDWLADDVYNGTNTYTPS